MLEGVGFALADGMDVVHACGVEPKSITLIGGGARSAYWAQLVADVLGIEVVRFADGDAAKLPVLADAEIASGVAVMDGGSKKGWPG